jgi:hypothetical protein
VRDGQITEGWFYADKGIAFDAFFSGLGRNIAAG